MNKKGLAQLPVIIGMLALSVLIPATVKLVEERQGRKQAEETAQCISPNEEQKQGLPKFTHDVMCKNGNECKRVGGVMEVYPGTSMTVKIANVANVAKVKVRYRPASGGGWQGNGTVMDYNSGNSFNFTAPSSIGEYQVLVTGYDASYTWACSNQHYYTGGSWQENVAYCPPEGTTGCSNMAFSLRVKAASEVVNEYCPKYTAEEETIIPLATGQPVSKIKIRSHDHNVGLWARLWVHKQGEAEDNWTQVDDWHVQTQQGDHCKTGDYTMWPGDHSRSDEDCYRPYDDEPLHEIAPACQLIDKLKIESYKSNDPKYHAHVCVEYEYCSQPTPTPTQTPTQTPTPIPPTPSPTAKNTPTAINTATIMPTSGVKIDEELVKSCGDCDRNGDNCFGTYEAEIMAGCWAAAAVGDCLTWDVFEDGMIDVSDLAWCAGQCGCKKITPTPSKDKVWTFVLYFNGDNNLAGRLGGAVQAIEKIFPNNDFVNVAVLYDGKGETEEFYLPRGEAMSHEFVGERNMGSQGTLVDFISGAMDRFPADYYFLSIADHGLGHVGMSWDDTSNGSYLDLDEIKKALDLFYFDVVMYDACLMGLVEDLVDVERSVGYWVGYQNEGWSVMPYGDYVGVVALNGRVEPLNLARQVADIYYNSNLIADKPRTVSVIDMRRVSELAEAVEALGREMVRNLGDIGFSDCVAQVRRQTQKFDVFEAPGPITEDEASLDIYDLAENLVKYCGDWQEVGQVAEDLKVVLKSTVVIEMSFSGLLFNGGNIDWNLDKANGLSVWFPECSYTGGSPHVLLGWESFLSSYCPGGWRPKMSLKGEEKLVSLLDPDMGGNGGLEIRGREVVEEERGKWNQLGSWWERLKNWWYSREYDKRKN